MEGMVTQDLYAARTLNEALVEKGDPEAIERKIISLSRCHLSGGLIHNAHESIPGNKIFLGYEVDHAAEMALNESIILRDLRAIERKIFGLIHGTSFHFSGWCVCPPYTYTCGYGYDRDLDAARKFIESLLISESPFALVNREHIRSLAVKYGCV